MKKKLLALLCAATMIVGASMSVCAAGSITADEVKNQAKEEVGNITSAEVKAEVKGDAIAVAVTPVGVGKVDITVPVTEAALEASAQDASKVTGGSVAVTAVPATQENVTKIVNIAKAAADVIQAEAAKDSVSGVKAEIKMVVDIEPTDGSDSVTLTYNVGTLADNQVVYALHATASGVEKILCTKSGKGVTFTLKSFSPVGFLVVTSEVDEDDDDDAAPAAAPATNVTSTTPTSPKTADVFAAVALLAAVSGTASAAFGRKAKKN